MGWKRGMGRKKEGKASGYTHTYVRMYVRTHVSMCALFTQHL